MERTLRGITLTAAGTTLYDGARAVLEQVDRLEHQVLAAAGARHLVVGTLADAAERLGRVLVDEFRRRHPEIGISIHEVDLGDPPPDCDPTSWTSR